MGMTDPIADMLTRMRNAAMAHHQAVDVPWSRVKEDILRVFVEEGYVHDVRKVQVEAQCYDVLRITLKFDKEQMPVMSRLVRVSRPGRRVYVGYRAIHPVRRGLGTHVLSTPSGIMVDREAVKRKLGGELLCSIC